MNMDQYNSKFVNKTLILVLTISLLGFSSGDYNEDCDCDIIVTANGEGRVLTVDSGETVELHGETSNLENITGYRWSFDRNIVNETETDLNSTDINITMYAVGSYNITFTISYDEETENGTVEQTVGMTISIFVDEAEEYDLDEEKGLFSVAALLQLAACCLLIYLVREGRK